MAWIFTIARNLAYQELRRANGQGTGDFDDRENASDEDSISQTIDNIVLGNALTISEKREYKITLLHVATGVKLVEIASPMKTLLGAALSSYHRTMRKLQKSAREGAVQ